MASFSVQDYNPQLDITIPPTVKEKGLTSEFMAMAKESEKLFEAISAKMPAIAPYALTNAHRRRVLFTCNARELYHFARLREDKHAQWDIRFLSEEMSIQARKAMPLVMMLICGKDKYPALFEKIFGRALKILPPAN